MNSTWLLMIIVCSVYGAAWTSLSDLREVSKPAPLLGPSGCAPTSAIGAWRAPERGHPYVRVTLHPSKCPASRCQWAITPRGPMTTTWRTFLPDGVTRAEAEVLIPVTAPLHVRAAKPQGPGFRGNPLVPVVTLAAAEKSRSYEPTLTQMIQATSVSVKRSSPARSSTSAHECHEPTRRWMPWARLFEQVQAPAAAGPDSSTCVPPLATRAFAVVPRTILVTTRLVKSVLSRFPFLSGAPADLDAKGHTLQR